MNKNDRDGQALADMFAKILNAKKPTAFRDCLLIHQIIDNFHDFGPTTRSNLSRKGQVRPTQSGNLEVVYNTYVEAGYHTVTHPGTGGFVSIKDFLWKEKEVDLLKIDVNIKEFKQGFLKRWVDSKRSVYYSGPNDSYDHLKSSDSSLTVERAYVQDVKFLKGQFPVGKASKTLAGIIDPSPMSLVPGGDKKKPITEGGGRDFVMHITKDKLLLPPLGFEITSSGDYDSDKTSSSFKYASCVTSKEMHIGYMLIKVHIGGRVFKSVGAVYKYYYDNDDNDDSTGNDKPQLNCLLNISNNPVSKELIVSLTKKTKNKYDLWSITLFKSKGSSGDRLYEWTSSDGKTADHPPSRQRRTGENLLRMVKNMFVEDPNIEGYKTHKYGQYKSLLVQYEHDNDGSGQNLRNTNCIVCSDSKIFSVKHLIGESLFQNGNPLTRLRILEAKYGGDFAWLVNLMMSNKYRTDREITGVQGDFWATIPALLFDGPQWILGGITDDVDAASYINEHLLHDKHYEHDKFTTEFGASHDVYEEELMMFGDFDLTKHITRGDEEEKATVACVKLQIRGGEDEKASEKRMDELRDTIDYDVIHSLLSPLQVLGVIGADLGVLQNLGVDPEEQLMTYLEVFLDYYSIDLHSAASLKTITVSRLPTGLDPSVELARLREDLRRETSAMKITPFDDYKVELIRKQIDLTHFINNRRTTAESPPTSRLKTTVYAAGAASPASPTGRASPTLNSTTPRPARVRTGVNPPIIPELGPTAKRSIEFDTESDTEMPIAPFIRTRTVADERRRSAQNPAKKQKTASHFGTIKIPVKGYGIQYVNIVKMKKRFTDKEIALIKKHMN